MPHSQALTAQPKPETEILAKADSKLDREKIALKMRLNEPLSPAVEPKTVTQEWIKCRGLGATKTGSRKRQFVKQKGGLDVIKIKTNGRTFHFGF